MRNVMTGASRGPGLEMARLAAAGYRVIAIARFVNSLEHTAADKLVRHNA
jgi:short-subunit dehydrogenase